MTLEQQINSYITGGTLSLPSAALGSEGIQQIIADFYSNGLLEITVQNVTANPAGTLVTVTGSSSFITVIGMPVSAVFETADTDVILTLTASLPATWTFSQSFTLLAGSFFDQLVLTGSSMILSSVTQTTPVALTPGLNYTGTISGGLPEPLSLLCTPPLSVTGPIHMESDVPVMNLALPAIKITLGSLVLPTVNCFFNTLPVQVSPDGSTWLCNSFITFNSNISMSGKSVSISGSYSVVTENLTIEVVNQSISLADGLNDIFSLVDYTPAISWPAAFDLDNIFLENISLSVSFSPTPSLDNFSFGIEWEAGWALIPNVVSLDKICVGIWISNPFTSQTRQFGGQIYGQFLLGKNSNAILDIYAQIPASGTDQGWTFSGSTQPGTVLEIGSVIADLTSRFGITVPGWVNQFTLTDFYFSVNTSSGNVNTNFTLDFPIGSTAVELTISAALTQSGGKYSPGFTARLLVGSTEFDVTVTGTGVSASADNIYLSDLVSSLFEDSDIDVSMLPAIVLSTVSLSYNTSENSKVQISAHLNLGDHYTGDFALVAQKVGTPATWQFVLLAGLGSTPPIDIGAQLPLAGKKISGEFELKEVYFLLTSKTPAGITLPAPYSGIAITPGVAFGFDILLAGQEQTVIVPLESFSTGDPTSPITNVAFTTALAPASGNPDSTSGSGNAQDSIHWIDINKTLGPLDLAQIGLNYSAGEASVGLSADFTFGGLALSAQGLEVTFPLPLPGIAGGGALSAGLKGLSLNFSKGDLSIGGAFLKMTEGGIVSYLGEVIVGLGSFGITAIGGYIPAQTINNKSIDDSFFIYANIKAPIGGPPFFFVTGLAFGLGVNYALNLPTINTLSSYALLPGNARPMPSPATTANVTDVLTSLSTKSATNPNPMLTQENGENWIAAGVNFTSFEMINGFAVATVAFGVDLQIAILGSASVSLPKGDNVTPLAYIEIDLMASYQQSSGLLAFMGVINPASNILDGAIKLSGGFALCIWTSGPHCGDFVFSIGGYNPSFNKPEWYPDVPRLTINFKLGPFQALGTAYVALTPGAFMAGLTYNATWTLGNIRAWFGFGVDFIVKWSPFNYAADAYITIGCKVNLWAFTLSVNIGAEAYIWGPEFGGKVHVDLDIITFTIHFGSDEIIAPPATWPQIETGFFPPPQAPANASSSPAAVPAIVSASVGEGLLQTNVTDSNYKIFDWIVSPDQFQLTTSSLIPATLANYNGAPVTSNIDWNETLYVKPMDTGLVASVHTITLNYISASGKQAVDTVVTTAVLQNANGALWGDPSENDVNAGMVIPNSLAGFIISPMLRDPDSINSISLDALIYETDNTFSFGFSVPQPDNTYTVTTEFSVNEMDITVSGATPNEYTNSDYILSALSAPWIAAQRNSILDELASAFGTYASKDVYRSGKMAQEKLSAWPLVTILGDQNS